MCYYEDFYNETLVIASETITTSEGMAYWVKKNGKTNWELMHTGIYNFNHETGYEYIIRVVFCKNKNAGPDQSTYDCHLLRIISKEKFGSASFHNGLILNKRIITKLHSQIL